MPRLWRWGIVSALCGLGLEVGGVQAQLPPPPATTAPAPPKSAAAAVAATPPPGFKPDNSEPTGEPGAQPLPAPRVDPNDPTAPTDPAGPGDLPPARAPYDPLHRTLSQNPFTGNRSKSDPNAGGFFGNLELLAWRPHMSTLDYAIAQVDPRGAATGPIQALNYQMQMGIRTNLGYRFADSAWDALFSYTYFRSSANQTTVAGNGGVILPTQTRPGVVDDALVARGLANLIYNVFDLDLGRRFVVDEYLAIRMYGALRFATIRSSFTSQYDGLEAHLASVDRQSNFDGFGPMLGAEAIWGSWRGFHLYSRANGGLLTGQSRNPLTESNYGGTIPVTYLDYTTHLVVPFAAVGIGGGWQQGPYSIRLGYEITNYFGLMQQPQLVGGPGSGKLDNRTSDLSLEGLFFQMGYSF